MKSAGSTPGAPPSSTIDAYIAAFPPEVRKILNAIRKTIRSVEPAFEEAIRYGIPTFQLDGKNIVHFAGHAKHTAVYPAPRGSMRMPLACGSQR